MIDLFRGDYNFLSNFWFIKKFKDEELWQKLLDTGDEELVEGNNWNDTFWGKCSGIGENHLGKILMKVRDEIKAS